MKQLFTLLLSALVITAIFAGNGYAQEKEKPTFSFGGDLHYRLRYDYIKKNDSEGEEAGKTADYTNLYAWNFCAKATINENLLFGMRLSNPSGGGPDKIGDNLKSMYYKNNGDYNFRIVSIPEMYLKWKASIVSLSFGIIPVSANTVLNLVYTEQHNYLTNGLCEIGLTSWKVWMNNSQTGLDLSFSFVDDDATSVGFSAVSAVASNGGPDSPAYALKNDQLRFIFSFPVSVLEKKLSFLPVMHLRTNVYRSADKEEANHSLTGGIDIGIKPVKPLGIKLGYAVGGFKNDAVAPEGSESAPLGMLTNATLIVQPGYGKASVLFNFGMTKDREADPVINNNLIHFDFKYAMPVKSLTIMPRVRIWNFTNSEDDASELRVRPELFFMGKF
jgi:hypothetical protein